MSAPFTARLLQAKTLCPEVRHFVLEALGDDPFHFQAGQYIRLTAAHGGAFEERYYSIASPPDGGRRFELCIKTGDDPIGRYLAQVRPGERFSCHGPAGGFNLRNPLRDSLFIGHGAGVAPLRAMLQTALGDKQDNGNRRLALLLGARTPDRLFYGRGFSNLEADLDTFHFLPVLSRPTADWTGRKGRVQAHLEEALGNFKSDFDIYLCGRPEMVADLRQRLAQAGIPKDAILFEKY